MMATPLYPNGKPVLTLIPPEASSGTYTVAKPKNNVIRIAASPTACLPDEEIESLKWFWQQAESDLGVVSTWGRQCERKATLQPSEEAARLVRKEVRDARKKRTLELAANDSPGPNVERGSKPAYDEHTEPQLMRIVETHSDVFVDPYPDSVFGTLRRARRVRYTLLAISRPHMLTLHACYGSSRGDAKQNATLKRRFRELTEIVVAMVALEEVIPYLPTARELAAEKTKDDGWVRAMVHGAERYLRVALESYAEKLPPWT
jgi:hypothetical protein